MVVRIQDPVTLGVSRLENFSWLVKVVQLRKQGSHMVEFLKT